MADLKVDYDGADANSISIYASPETLRAIADQMEERVMVWVVEGRAVDIDEHFAEPAHRAFIGGGGVAHGHEGGHCGACRSGARQAQWGALAGHELGQAKYCSLTGG